MSPSHLPSTPRAWRLACGPALAVLALLWLDGRQPAPIVWTVAITACCAAWWMLEALPHAVTALLPLALFPLVGVLTPTQIAQSYGHPLILLLAGGFMLAAALEANGAHRRLALMMVRLFGGRSGRSLIFGFAAAAGLISMWISNTATTLMLLPVAMAVLRDYRDPRLAAPLVLAIAYCASIGGLGTPIGSPPNLVFMQVYQQATGASLGFSDWAVFGIPTVLLLLPLAALWLARGLGDTPPASLPALGPWRAAERRVLAVFALVALAWVTRSEPFGGWQDWLGIPQANDASVALLGVMLMAALPSGEGRKLLTWETAERIPWGALILFGGGIALATAFDSSGLSDWLAAELQGVVDAPLVLRIFLIALAVSLLSEIASNTASAVLLMPLLAAAAKAAGIDPALLMVPAVLAASCAFILPVATAPNAIVFGSGMVDGRSMMRHGVVVNLVAILVITVVCATVLG
ncbi:SLC13 family permease [Pseudomarimonas salicorniae]|uniref:SLC13 family permease n=1 Tax=Pseudomarimonas salicorniae TaxID=2933270 RepID=A0ABT0GKN6_9GAMM|nr:SLC13 family permease [Lysobacter sp. CAU 1642]MCK7595099.1 SLC13 family permease [Lysobacter sp. CAU 1642]